MPKKAEETLNLILYTLNIMNTILLAESIYPARDIQYFLE